MQKCKPATSTAMLFAGIVLILVFSCLAKGGAIVWNDQFSSDSLSNYDSLPAPYGGPFGTGSGKTWTISGGHLNGDGFDSKGSLVYKYFQDDSTNSVTVKAGIAWPQDNDIEGLLLGYKDNDNTYFLSLFPQTPDSVFGKKVNGITTVLSTIPHADLYRNGVHNIEVSLMNSTWVVKIDDNIAGNGFDSSLAGGRVGLFSVDDRSNYYDYFTVEIPEPATVLFLTLGGLALRRKK